MGAADIPRGNEYEAARGGASGLPAELRLLVPARLYTLTEPDIESLSPGASLEAKEGSWRLAQYSVHVGRR
jgi:hypothetical protein